MGWNRGGDPAENRLRFTLLSQPQRRTRCARPISVQAETIENVKILSKDFERTEPPS